jgi:hypothetical protein
MRTWNFIARSAGKGRKTMKAWCIKTNDEELGDAIVFHESNAAARRIGANSFGLDFEDVECIRAEYCDKYADTSHVPPKVLVENGWMFPCWECETIVEKDMDDFDKVVFSGKHGVYCCQECKDIREARIEKVNREAWEFYVSLVNGWCKWDVVGPPKGFPWYTPECEITFPGIKHGASVGIRRQGGKNVMVLLVANGDRESYKAWEAE